VLAACVLGGAAAVGLAGCGGSSPPSGSDPRAGAVVRAVQSFAGATGPKACDLLTDAALARLYGGRTGGPARPREFPPGPGKGDSVTIGKGGTRAVAQAQSLGGRGRFTVVAVLVEPPGCHPPCPQAAWRIDSVKPR